MQGKIIKGIAGFYYIYGEDGILYECKGRGILRQKKITPLVGDDVIISVEDADKHIGNLDEILERRNSLIRPAVANVDQALLVFARTDPMPNMGLMDRLLIAMEQADIPCIIAFNKSDLDLPDDIDIMSEAEAYEAAGYKVFHICVNDGTGLEELKACLSGTLTTLAGPSGVGKSSLINYLCPEASMQTGEISEKLGRGRHTTRHAEILVMDNNSYIVDTPGFTSYDVNKLAPEDLADYYRELYPYVGKCRFNMCSHTHEPGCAVHEAIEKGELSSYRYERYVKLYEELKNVRRY